VQAHIHIVNTGTQTRNFTFVATPFSGPGNPAAKVAISSSGTTLAPNASANITADLTVTSDFQPGARYDAELQIYGAYEQCVRMTLDVAPPIGKECAVERCEVRAGDLPSRIRAHQWYHHFQCVEPCVELLRPPADQ
jgi:hypothetical protein